MNKVMALLALFRQGSEVGNPGAWKNPTIVANVLLAIVGAAVAFGFKVELTAENANAIAGGVLAAVGLVNGVVHAVTSKRAGLPAADKAAAPEPAEG